MNKILKITLITLIAFILLVMTALTILVNVVDPNEYKKQISSTVQETTGRQLTINGKIEWSLFPWLGLKINDVNLSNAAGFGEKTFLSLKTAHASIKLIPLLFKEIEIGTLSLEQAQINLARNSVGVNNWDDIINAHKPSTSSAELLNTPHKTEHYEKTKKNISFSIDNIEITNASLNWENQQNPQILSISNFELKAKHVQLDHSFPLFVKAEVSEVSKKVHLHITLSSKIQLSSDFNTARLHSTELNLNNLFLKGNLDIEHLQSKPSFGGDLNLPTFDLSQLAISLGQTLPATQNADSFKKFSLKTNFSGDTQSLHITDLLLKLDDISLKGQATVNSLTAPAITFDLVATAINLDNYKPVTQSTKAPSASLPSSPPISQTTPSISPTSNPAPIETKDRYAGLRKLDLQGKISIASLTAMKLTTTDASLLVIIKNGLFQIQNLQAKLYEGSTLSYFSYDVRTNTPKITAKSTLSNVQIQPLLKDFMSSELFAGSANLNIDITTQGTTPEGLIRTLNGAIGLNIINGQLNNIDLNYQVERAKALLTKQTTPSESSPQVTHFDKLLGTAKIINGVVNNNDFTLESNALTAKGMGTIDLPNQNIHYLLKIRALNAGELSHYEIPLNIKGSLKTPSMTPDFNSILQQVANQTLNQEINTLKEGKNQQALVEQGKKLLNGLF
jgi:AsmA protein